MSRDRSIKETKDGSRTDGAEDNTNTRLRNDIAVVPPANKSELDTRTGSKQSYGACQELAPGPREGFVPPPYRWWGRGPPGSGG